MKRTTLMGCPFCLTFDGNPFKLVNFKSYIAIQASSGGHDRESQTMKKIIIPIAAALCSLAAVAQTNDDKYLKEFEEFVNYSLTVDILDYLREELDEYIDKQPEEIAERIRNVYPQIERQYRDFIFNEMISIYRNYLDYKDLRSINKFYRSRAGRNLRNAQYPIMTEMMSEVDKLTGSISAILAGCFTEPGAEE